MALIDWDMGTRGDPLFDLATLLSYWAEPGDPAALHQLQQMPTAQPGFWSRAQMAKRYAELTGCDPRHTFNVRANSYINVLQSRLAQPRLTDLYG